MKCNDFSKTINNEIIFKYLTSLFSIINNWENEYVDTKIIDGETWKLSITYLDGYKKEYLGKSKLPFNFEALERLNKKLINEV